MPFQTMLPSRLAKYGLTVEVVPGWASRGSSSFNPKGAVGHHTAGPRTGIRPSLNVCVNGHGKLPGPLCNTFLDRNGVVVVVAAGRANHAGVGGYRGLVGNSSVFGTEAEDDGDGNWTDAQIWAYPRVMAAQLDLAGVDHTWYCSHRRWATPPGRKVDPGGIADSWMQDQIKAVFASQGPAGEGPAEEEDDDMKAEDKISFNGTAARLSGKPEGSEMRYEDAITYQLAFAQESYGLLRNVNITLTEIRNQNAELLEFLRNNNTTPEV
jgi:hypothetical protein